MGKRKTDDDETKEQRKERKRLKKEQKKKTKKKGKKEKKQIKETASSQDEDDTATTGQEVFFRKKLELTISLLRAALGDVLGNVEDALRLFLLKYSDGIGGIFLSFENVKILSDNKGSVVGMILNELPHIHYRVSADALVFCPSPGCKMSGSVTEASFHSHLSLVVHQYFNASVSADHLREAGFEFDDVELQWYWQAAANMLSKDAHIDFVCQKMYESGGIISIEGSNPALRAK
jgi:RPA43 OB domain in RNA Pol I